MNASERLKLLCLLLVLVLAGCSRPSSERTSPVEQGLPAVSGRPISLTGALPAAGAVQGWKPAGEAQVYDGENLYDLVDGQADAFFAYAFEQVVVQNYENDDGQGLRLEIWQLATPADAYGLFSTYRAGTPVAIGNEGDTDPGRRLDFWQERYLVRLFAPQALTDADLQAFAGAVAAALPTGGARPSLLGRLPEDVASPTGNALADEAIFFRQEISVQDYLWLGGQNRLGLGSATAGVLARVVAGDETGILLLVEYPEPEAAQAALNALNAGEIDTMVMAQAEGVLLGAVFGAVSEQQASELLANTFEDQ